jgi:hypothetical protein
MPSGAPVGGPSPASPTPFTDLSDKLPAHYQLLDAAASTIEQAINTGGFYQEPKVLAGVRSIHAQLANIIANGSKGGTGGSTPEAPSISPDISDSGPLLDDEEGMDDQASDTDE